MRSSLYVGTVAHERRIPRRNSFRYGIYYLFADLDDLDRLDSGLRLFAHNRPALVSLHDKDHGDRTGSPLRPWIDGVLSEAGIDLGNGGKVFLLTFPRVLGFKFYPVSFWYCFHADGSARAILAEVRNTFGEHHNYLLHCDGQPMDWTFTPETVKAFHVSPFIEMDAKYRFRFSPPGERLSVSIHDFVKGELLLVAAVSLKRHELTNAALLRTVARYGPMSLRAWLLIHFQALRLVSKRIKYIPKPPPPQETPR